MSDGIIKFKCPTCKSYYEVDSSFEKGKGECQECHQKFIIPAFIETDIIRIADPAGPPPPSPKILPEKKEKVISDSAVALRPPPSKVAAQRAKQEKRETPEPTKQKQPKRKPSPSAPSRSYAPLPKKNKSSTPLVIIILILLIGAGGYFFFNNKKKTIKNVHNKITLETIEKKDDKPQKITEKKTVAKTTIPEKTTDSPAVKTGKYAQELFLDFESKSAPEESLIAEFNFDGSLDNKITPSAPATKTGNNNPCEYVPGISGKAIKLSKNPKYKSGIKLPDDIINQESGTISMWLQHGEAIGAMWGLTIFFSKKEKKSDYSFKWDEHTYTWSVNTSGDTGAFIRSAYSYPNHNEWINITITWDKEKNFQRIYLNGKLDNYYASMPLTPGQDIFSDKIILQLGPGHKDQYDVIDDLKAYNRALSSSEIKKIYQEYAPVEVVLSSLPESKATISAPRNSTKEFNSKVRLLSDADFSGKLKLETLDTSDNVLWKKTVDVNLSKSHPTLPLSWQIPFKDQIKFVYVKATLEGYKTSPTWSLKLSCVPSNPIVNVQRGIRINKKVLTIDCTKPAKDNFISNCKTKIVKSSCGRYRETSPKSFEFFSYKFKIKKVGYPHILKVTYPDDKPRVFALDLNDGSGAPPQGAGIQTGCRTPLTNKMQVQNIFFWPMTENCALTVCNWSTNGNNGGSIVPYQGTTAALAKIEVLELKDKLLPKNMMPNLPKKESRSIGIWVEDSSLSGYWGVDSSKSHILEGWASGCERLARYMNFVGINTFQYPVVWYDGTLFRSPTLEAFNCHTNRTGEHPFACFGQLLKIFEAHNLKFFPTYYLREAAALYFQTTKANPKKFYTQINEKSWEYRYKTSNPGGDDMFQYYRNGGLKMDPYNTQGVKCKLPETVGPTFNPIHPAVMKLSSGIVKDWLKLYGHSPALGGILLDMGLSWAGLPQADSFSFNRLDSGYGDYTISLFEKDTGIKVPGEKDDPERFAKRYKFLTTGTMRDKWINWRCKQIHDKVVMPIYQIMKRTNPNLKLQIGIGSRRDIADPLNEKAPTWEEVAKECGIDINLYKGVKNITLIRHGASSQNVTKCYPHDNLDASWPFDNGSESGVCSISSSYWEMFSYAKLLDELKKKWPETKPNQMPVRTIIDAKGGLLAHTAYALMKTDFSEIYIGGMGNPATFGHESFVIPFFRAFRSLPRVKFEDIKGLEDPVRVRQKVVDGHNYVYIVNSEPYSIPTTLTLSEPPGKIEDMGRLKTVEIKTNTLKLLMKPYSLIALKFANKAKVLNGSASIPEREIKKLSSKIMKLKSKYMIPIKMHPKESPKNKYIWVEAENWDKWETNERFSLKKDIHNKDSKYAEFVSGNEAIGFGGDWKPVVYNLKTDKSGHYIVWVKFVIQAKNQTSKWEGKIDDKSIGKCKTPVEKEPLWVKLGEVDLSAGNFKFSFNHATANYSYLVDAFLITDDKNYQPKGVADTNDRIKNMKKMFSPSTTELRKKHMAKARALITVLEGKQ